jgi:hypothetical protein
MKQLLLALTIALTFTQVLIASAPSTSSWFREKYLQKTYDEQYENTFTRHRFGDNNRDVCTEVHKPAIFFAITGRRMSRSTQQQQPQTRLYIRRRSTISVHYKPPSAHDVQLIDITAMDVIVFLNKFIYYVFEISMILSSIVLASFSTLCMIMLLFCQY